MFYRTVGRFANTESAQSAAHRINMRIPEVFEIRLHYRSDYSDSYIASNVVYVQNSNLNFPSMQGNDIRKVTYSNSFPGLYFGEVSDECHLTVITEEKDNDSVREIMFNEGGYDVKTSSVRPV